MDKPQDPQVELAAIKEQLIFIKEGVDEVKVSVTKLLSIDRTVAALEVKSQSYEEKISDMSDRVDALEQRQSTNTAYLNKIRGGISLTTAIMGLIQAGVLAAAGWLLTSVIDLHNEITVLKTEIHYTQQEHERVMRSLLAAKQAALTVVEEGREK